MTSATQHLSLDIQGMNCRSCVAHIETALAKVAGVDHVVVSLAARTATVEGDQLDAAKLIEAVRDAGYQASATANG